MAAAGKDDSIRCNLERQLDEIEMLQSIYSQADEFIIEDENAFTCLKKFVEFGLPEQHPNHIEFTVHLTIETNGKEPEIDIEITCRLSNNYPSTEGPEVHVHSDFLTRSGQDNLNKDLLTYIANELPVGDVNLLSIIEWAHANALNYYTPVSQISMEKEEEESQPTNEFCRMWLYMHHIYSKVKRRNILSLANELELTGFCLSGKPGVVCVEGESSKTKQFYGVVRRWNWKSISCRKRETFDNTDAERKFNEFIELFFVTHGGRSNNMNLGKFREYLQAHELEFMFKELFGVDSNPT